MQVILVGQLQARSCSYALLLLVVDQEFCHFFLLDAISSWQLIWSFKFRCFFKSQLFPTTHTYKSHIVIYDVETGEKLSKKLVELQDRGVALIRHINALDSAHIVCSVGRDLQVIPCNLKLKID